MRWARRSREETGSTVAARCPVSDLEAEDMRLRRELANAKLDLDIVKHRSHIS